MVSNKQTEVGSGAGAVTGKGDNTPPAYQQLIGFVDGIQVGQAEAEPPRERRRHV